jgi:hypothetical protein
MSKNYTSKRHKTKYPSSEAVGTFERVKSTGTKTWDLGIKR